jgi:hypothetical protein
MHHHDFFAMFFSWSVFSCGQSSSSGPYSSSISAAATGCFFECTVAAPDSNAVIGSCCRVTAAAIGPCRIVNLRRHRRLGVRRCCYQLDRESSIIAAAIPDSIGPLQGPSARSVLKPHLSSTLHQLGSALR